MTLGGAAIGALAGLAVSYVQHRTKKDELTHAETEAWRQVLVETTGAFIDAWHEFRWFLRARSMESSQVPVFDETSRVQFDPMSTRCAQTVDKVMLVFGRTTQTGKAAEEVDEKIWALKLAVSDAPTRWNEATKTRIRNLLDEAVEAQVEFVKEAHVACQPPAWKEPGTETSRKGRWPFRRRPLRKRSEIRG